MTDPWQTLLVKVCHGFLFGLHRYTDDGARRAVNLLKRQAAFSSCVKLVLRNKLCTVTARVLNRDVLEAGEEPKVINGPDLNAQTVSVHLKPAKTGSLMLRCPASHHRAVGGAHLVAPSPPARQL